MELLCRSDRAGGHQGIEEPLLKGQTENHQPEDSKFGTFGGVFTPCSLTILGVIMFLRFGHVVGQAGAAQAIAIVLMANAITLLTTLSLSAVATNTRVKGGGAYYLISRSLGVEFGGTIGIVFYLAQAVAVAMYVVGFTEAFVDAFPNVQASVRTIATLVNVLVFVCVYIGAGWTIKVQYGILGILALALTSFVLGAFPEFTIASLRRNAETDFGGGENPFTMFALFFPAVTGIMAGANMSGDLKNPSRSIPLGTLSAIAVTATVYLGLTVLLAGACSRTELQENNLVMKDASQFPVLISAGVFAATLSSALSSMMGAPRILQAFSRDKILKGLRSFARGSQRRDEPRRAIVLTFVIAQAAVLLGDLNAIAPVITMAFLTTYGLLNLATFYESITRNPSFRPRFRLSHWSTALAGAVGCLAAMVLIAPLWAAALLVSMTVIHWYIGRLQIKARWGDVRRGILFERARKNLLEMEDEQYHPKSWRPIVLALSGPAGHRVHIAAFGQWLTTGHGILTLGQVIPGDIEDRITQRANQERILRDFIRKEELQAFPAVVVTPDLFQGIESLVQIHGLGGFRPNTVLVGWPAEPDRIESFGATLRTVAGLGQSIVALRCVGEIEDPWEAPRGTIDVWWRGLDNGAMMLLLAHLLLQNAEWRSRPIRLFRVIPSEAGREEVTEHLKELISVSRIDATPRVIVGDNVADAIHGHSAVAAVVFLGLTPPDEGEEDRFFETMEKLGGPLERVIFVYNGGGMSLDT